MHVRNQKHRSSTMPGMCRMRLFTAGTAIRQETLGNTSKCVYMISLLKIDQKCIVLGYTTKTMAIQRILVPCDFMEESFVALLHAVHLAAKSNAEVVLLNLNESPGDFAESEKKIALLKERLSNHTTQPIRTLVEVGDIILHIGVVSKREDCQLIVLPTHGMKGMQQFTGSLALTVVSESKTPFIIVQEKNIQEHGYKRIVIPIEFRPQLLDELDLFLEIAVLFNSEIFVISHSKYTAAHDNSILEKLEQKFKEAHIPVNFYRSGKFDFSKAVAEYAMLIDADLICTVNFAFENLYALYPRTDEEDLIYNAGQIPVMLVTPEVIDDNVNYIPMVE